AAALLWAWSDESTLGERFVTARKITRFLFRPQCEPAGSYQAFLKMLRRWTAALVLGLQVALRERMREEFPDCWETHGFVVFGVDGSRTELPRTLSHEEAFSAARKNGRKKKGRRRNGKQRKPDPRHAKKGNSPQMWLTLMWHAGTGLPWDWRTGPADSSERAHWMQMLDGLPPNALIAADAGFVGYEYAKAVRDCDRHLLLRVGSNVRLLRKLGYTREYGNTVYLWPDRAAAKGQPPLVLRLVVAHNGRHPVYLVTSVLEKSVLSDKQVVELYARRWGIELFFRNLKQTFDRRKLRSTTADNARVEMEWSLVGLWAMGLYTLREVTREGIPPDKVSFAAVLRAFRRMMRDFLHPSEPGQRLCDRLRKAITDSYQRGDKTSRDYPRKKQESPPGPPEILDATEQQIARAQSLSPSKPRKTRKGLTA
ncbi:MAG: transposase, partial [Planctomycetaceae bacterium]